MAGAIVGCPKHAVILSVKSDDEGSGYQQNIELIIFGLSLRARPTKAHKIPPNLFEYASSSVRESRS